jgi:hypothetical protein
MLTEYAFDFENNSTKSANYLNCTIANREDLYDAYTISTGQSSSQSEGGATTTKGATTVIEGNSRVGRIFWDDREIEIAGERLKVEDVSESAKGPRSDDVVHWKVLNKDWYILMQLQIKRWRVSFSMIYWFNESSSHAIGRPRFTPSQHQKSELTDNTSAL